MSFTGPIEDRLAIRELLDIYADAVCVVDAKTWGSTWAEDAIWELPGVPGAGTITGRSNIIATWQAAMAQFPGILFVASPGVIRIDGNRAWARSYTSEVYDRDGITHRDRGRYDDELVKQGGQWLFHKRVFTRLHSA